MVSRVQPDWLGGTALHRRHPACSGARERFARRVRSEVAQVSVRVFIAEDNDDLARLVTRRLEANAWHVTRARTATEAAATLRGDRFDAIILDYKLPDGNGLELLSIAREAAPATPVLFLTAHGSEDVALQALGLGATDYMVKTGTMLEDLPLRVKTLLGREADMRRAATVSISVKGVARADAQEGSPLAEEVGAKVLESFVKGEVIGAALYDGSGQPIAALLPGSIDARALGIALVQVHAQAVLMGRVTNLLPRSYAFTMETEEGTIAASAVPGRAIVAVVVKPGSTHAGERLRELASRVR